MLMVALAAVALASPTDHQLIHYNARLALREGQPTETVKLWLLRNALEDQTRRVSSQDGDLRTTTWAALGALGLCTDGLRADGDGVGLWPLAMHNWTLRNMRRGPPPRRPRPYDAFEVDRQHRFIGLRDVLDAEELDTVTFSRGRCVGPLLELTRASLLPTKSLADRAHAAAFLRHLLGRARDTVDRDRVRGWAVIDARIFDLELMLAAFAEREARQKARDQARRARDAGLSRRSIDAMRDEAPRTVLAPTTTAGRTLTEAVTWPVHEWMALDDDRRLFLFDRVVSYTFDEPGAPEVLDALALGVIDALAAQGRGDQVERWIARRPRAERPEARRDIWAGARGRTLLALGDESGFRERGVIALHRGIDQLQRGMLQEALRSFAVALQRAPSSREPEQVQALARRWLSYVASQFVITDELLGMLQVVAPRRDYAVVLEDLMWRAAFHADAASFTRGLDGQLGRGALERRLDLLQPLAAGDLGAFEARLGERAASSPREALRFVGQLLDRLEVEDAGIRAHHLPTLDRVRALLLPLTDTTQPNATSRAADQALGRIQSILEGLDALGEAPSLDERVRGLSPDRAVYAGSVRLAPTDAVPWPFAASIPASPSVFRPLQLLPVEWADGDGGWVFGWQVRE